MNRDGRVRGLYAIADTGSLDDATLPDAVARALRGGARILQYRDKRLALDLRRRQAATLRACASEFRALFIVNDDVSLAKTVGADGVHLGRDDPAIEEARGMLGRDAIIGVSCYNDLARAEIAAVRGADYVAFGSFFPSPTKPAAARAQPALLLEARKRLSLPLVAIGGITPENGAALIAAGADALAVISGIFAHHDIEAAARRYAALFQPMEKT